MTPAELDPTISFHSFVKGVLHAAEQSILSACQNPDGWTPVIDADGNRDVPDTERQVIVFLCGDRGMCDPRPSSSAGYGLRFGYYDLDKHFWRVGGQREQYVTHWREVPDSPPLPADYSPPETSEEDEDP